MKRIPYNIEITSKEQARRVMDALLQYGGQMVDSFKYPNNRYRYLIRVMLWEGTEQGFNEIANVPIQSPPIVYLGTFSAARKDSE